MCFSSEAVSVVDSVIFFFLFHQNTFESNSKKKRHLAEYHYGKANEYIDVTLYPMEWLRLNLERVALMEHQLSVTRGKETNKIYEAILKIFFSLKKVFVVFGEGGGLSADEHVNPYGLTGEEDSGSSTPEVEKSRDCRVLNKEIRNCSTVDEDNSNDCTLNVNEEFITLAKIFETRLKHCLQQYIKYCSNMKNTVSKQQKVREDVLKRMFELMLRASVKLKTNDVVQLSCFIVETIISVEKIYDNLK